MNRLIEADMKAPHLPERFWSKVDKSGNCWVWTSSLKPRGYGEFHMNGKTRYAHRLAYADAFGAIPHGKIVDHLCYKRECVNPSHMRLVDNTANIQNRGAINRNNKSGVRGVHWSKRSQRWIAQAKLNGKHRYIGTFLLLEEARNAVEEWRRENMPNSLMDRR